MCGIAGGFGMRGGVEEQRQRVLRMIKSIEYRGPDSNGSWVCDKGSVALGHARLSILDLSECGAQPMTSTSGRFVISYNGEVYNFEELRKELEISGIAFRGHSDTEVILAAIQEWGLERAVSRFVGMFAFALWDKEQQQLSLVRDRLGIKPLYYRIDGSTLTFASELKAIRLGSGAPLEVDRKALALFMRHNYVPSPYSIFEGVLKLEPGTMLKVSRASNGQLHREVSEYWSIESVTRSASSRFEGTYAEAVSGLESTLATAVSSRMIADVPLGAFLSGGIDSSTVVALMQNQASRPVKTFSIGFTEDEYNEARWAKKVAEHLGTNHHELYVSPSDAQSVIPDLPAIFDEPFSDSSQIPTILVSRLAKEYVTVSLSGDGGDELLSGYTRYDLAASLWRKIGWLPAPVRNAIGVSIGSLAGFSPAALDRLLDPLYRRYGRSGKSRDKLRKAASALQPRSREAFYRHLVSHWKDPASIVVGIDSEPESLLGNPPAWMSQLGFHEYMMAADSQTYLPDDILVKVDRASMSCSLEARVPILDHRVVEYCAGLPIEMKRRDGRQKAPLKDILSRYVPEHLIDRPKMGFGVPINEWMRGPLREWSGDLLSAQKLRQDGFLDPGPIVEKWQEHVSGERNWSGQLWDVLMFQAWLNEQDSEIARAA